MNQCSSARQHKTARACICLTLHSMTSKADTWVRAYNRVLGRQLKCINTSHNLIHVASHRGRVVQGQLELLVRADDEDCSDSQRQVIAVLVSRVQHAIPASLYCFENTRGIQACATLIRSAYMCTQLPVCISRLQHAELSTGLGDRRVPRCVRQLV